MQCNRCSVCVVVVIMVSLRVRSWKGWDHVVEPGGWTSSESKADEVRVSNVTCFCDFLKENMY